MTQQLSLSHLVPFIYFSTPLVIVSISRQSPVGHLTWERLRRLSPVPSKVLCTTTVYLQYPPPTGSPVCPGQPQIMPAPGQPEIHYPYPLPVTYAYPTRRLRLLSPMPTKVLCTTTVYLPYSPPTGSPVHPGQPEIQYPYLPPRTYTYPTPGPGRLPVHKEGDA
ncbi:hypothetical protein BDV93DRAFT_513920 [Ceratobasidium sp. AG-I]|nr:hypothetical protein BDV93DRAFT_513920 [Ceratobasidium sp. AG-I]